MRTLSNRIESIEYVHARDGQRYRHDFTKGNSRIVLRDDGSVAIKNASGKKLWALFDVDGDTRPYLINPKRGARTMAKRKMSALQRKYFGKGHKKNAPKRRRRRAVAKANPAPKRRRRRNPVTVTRTRRRYRRNPTGFSINGILGQIQQGAKDGALVASGKLGVRLVSSQFSYPDGSMMDSAVELLAALGLGMLGSRFLGRDEARFLLAGGFDSVIENLVAQAGIPRVSALLGSTVVASTSAVYPPADAAALRDQRSRVPFGANTFAGYSPQGTTKRLSIGNQFAGYPAPSVGARGMSS